MRIYIVFILLFSSTPDNSDVLLLRGETISNFEINLEYVTRYYGLKYKVIDLSTTNLTDSSFLDEDGELLSGICITSDILEDTLLIDSSEFLILMEKISQGMPIFISQVSSNSPRLSIITEDAITGATVNNDITKTYFITSTHPQITLEFTGKNFYVEGGIKDFSLSIEDSIHPLVGYVPVSGDTFINFAFFNEDGKRVFVQAKYDYGNSLDQIQMYKLYKPKYLSVLIPTMFFIKYVGGEECWHNDVNYANLTIDDPKLVNPYGYLDYFDLLPEMMNHNFHTTIAFIPKNYLTSEEDVIELFLEYPEYYSLAQHGNNHDGYEFCFYTWEPIDSMCQIYQNWWCDSSVAHPRSLEEQEADIVEGLTRLLEHEKITGVPFSRVMIFPFGISPSPTLKILKKYNYLATINGSSTKEVPIGSAYPSDWDFRMRPACMSFEYFPSVLRYSYIYYVENYFYRNVFDLFIDKPHLLFSHHHQLFQSGIDAFNSTADSINSITGGVEWRDLSYIMKRMYLKKENDDGSWDVLFYTNKIILENNSTEDRVFHLKKLEDLNVPILSVTSNGIPSPYYFVADTLVIDISLAPRETTQISITYSSGEKDFAVFSSDIYYNEFTRTLGAFIYNLGNEGGPVPVQFFDGNPDSGGISLGITTVEWIEPDSFGIAELDEIYLEGVHFIYVFADPHNVIIEQNESNNLAFGIVGGSTKIEEPRKGSGRSAQKPLNFEFYPIVPNPIVQDKFLIRYSLPREGHVEINLYNSAGRYITTIFSGIQGEGFYSIYYDYKVFKNLKSGVYFLKLSTEKGSRIQRFILLH
jgi:hypothetical protein